MRFMPDQSTRPSPYSPAAITGIPKALRTGWAHTPRPLEETETLHG
jgi:hypothetical protein